MPQDLLNPARAGTAFRVRRFLRMKRGILLFALAVMGALASPVIGAGPLTGARITHIVNDVKTAAPETTPQRASVNDPVEPGKAVRTGIDSRTEMLFSDQTITRLGANSTFTVNSGTRDISLSKGVILIQVPKGAGGAKIQTNAVTAAITGTTILLEIVNGFTKLTVLEGTCILVLRNDLLSKKTTVTAGQFVRFSDDATEIPNPRRANLRAVFKNSPLLADAWGVQLDQTHLAAALAAQDGIDFGGIGILKVNGVVLVNKKPAKDGDTVHSGDTVETDGNQTAIIIVNGGGQITLAKLTRARVGGGDGDPVTAVAVFGDVQTFGLEDINHDSVNSSVDLGPYLMALGAGNVSGGSSAGGSSASGDVITVVQPGGLIFVFDSLGHFIRIQ